MPTDHSVRGTRTDHWSASQFQTWDLCPTTYRERYIDGVAQDVTEAMYFGSSIHHALETHYLGGYGDQAFKSMWLKFPGAHLERWAQLGGVGLHLLGAVVDLNLKGEPEIEFCLDTVEPWLKPTIGFMDLVDHAGRRIYDFKTTIGTWGEGRANQDPWQPTLYRWAMLRETGDLYDFSYVTLNKRTLEVATIEPTVEYYARWSEILEAGRMIAQMDAQGAYPCRGGHGTCPECAGQWQHGHVCNWELAPPRIHIRPKTDAEAQA